MRASLIFLVAVILAGILVAILTWVAYSSGWIHEAPNPNELVTYLGLVIGGFSFIFAAWLAIIAVTAYGHISDIEQKATDAKRLHAEAEKEFQTLRAMIADAKGHGESFLRYVGETEALLAEFMTTVEPESAERVKELHLILKRYMLSTAVTERERLDAARELVEFGEREDLEAVEHYLIGLTSNDARSLHKVLRAKLHAFDQARQTAAAAQQPAAARTPPATH
ncbi:MAG TPA: hypothetical protein VII56_05805 [Rhizomicrobium sp.]